MYKEVLDIARFIKYIISKTYTTHFLNEKT